MSKHLPKLTVYFVVIGFLSSLVFWPAVITWMPALISDEGQAIDDIYWAMVILSVVILAIVMAIVVYSIRHFKAVPGDDSDGAHIHGHTVMEVMWIVMAAIIVLSISYASTVILVDAEEKPAAGTAQMPVNVEGFQFGWEFSYPEAGIKGATNLVVPVNTLMRFTIWSRPGDVLHSFWVPEARLKIDAIPTALYEKGEEDGKQAGDPKFSTPLQWTANKITIDRKHQYQVVCAELCGSGHNAMRTDMCVVDTATFDKWVAEKGTKTCSELAKEAKQA